MPQISSQTILKAMFREEWQMHSSLFGERRFALFPVLIFALTSIGTAGLTLMGSDPTSLLLAIYALAFLFGLQTGSIVFIGQDALDNMLGETTFLLFTGRILPVAEKRMLRLFVVKDLVYYAFLFLLPITLGSLPPILELGSVWLLPLMWGTLTGTFLLGILLTVLSVSLGNRVPKQFRPAMFIGILGLVGIGSETLLQWTPYTILNTAIEGGVDSFAILRAITPIVVGAVIADWVFEPVSTARTRTNFKEYAVLSEKFPQDSTGLVPKFLLDIHRSSGGVFKVLFSAGLLFAVTTYLLQLIPELTGVTPSTGLAFGGLLGLTAFPVYNWITQFNEPEDYQFLPVSIADVFEAKRTAFTIIAIPVATLYYGIALFLFGAEPVTTILGFGLLLTVSHYVYGLTSYLTGFSPNEFLFDAIQFGRFTIGVIAGVLPVLIIGLFITTITVPLAVFLIAYMAVGNVAAIWFTWSAVPKWEREIRNGN